MKSILDPTFIYTKSINTDIRKTFQRVREEQARIVVPTVVTPLTNTSPKKRSK